MADLPNNAKKIAALKAVLNSGAKSHSTDGVSTTFQDPAEIRRQIAELEAESSGSTSSLKPRVRSINLSRAFGG